MGIPGLYRWLIGRYPNTLCDVVEDRSPYFIGPGVDTSKRNPNGVEFDNLYIDMNGIIHPCFHPEGLPAPRSYHEVFEAIFRYIERVFSIVRPRKLLFLAVDGVAPRAKMNHQRIRRFRAAKEAGCKISATEEVEGISKSEADKKLDSNVITPGTEFMALLSSALKYYVHWMMNANPAWRSIKVILSDSSVVGEGEHKIMSYIRSQRNLRGYDPNTRHCLHGLDADLIMLALATHEIHFSILREVPTKMPMSAKGKKKLMNNLDEKKNHAWHVRKFIHTLKFEFFNIWVLREYLERELLPNAKEIDFERLIDDFVFMCLFVGNDFLPHLPSLDISEGGIELLLIVYQQEFHKMGYLTDSYKVNLKHMEHFVQALSSHEKDIFMKRIQVRMEEKSQKRKATQGSSSDNDQHSLLELQSPTYAKPIYYIEKFDAVTKSDCDRIQKDAVLKYTEGICWVMHYYYQGVCSWQWFYPYHYAPLASDFRGLDELEVHFTLGQPLKPLDQLLAVLPAASAQALPLFYRELMINPSSPILDFYPKDAKVDRNGKKRDWQGVYKLPFIEESRLLSEIVKVEHTLTDKETKRNMLGRDRLFVHLKHPLAGKIKNHPLSDPSSEVRIKIKPELSGGMNGYVCISKEPVCPMAIHSPVINRQTIKQNRVISVYCKYPSFRAHISKLPDGVIMPPRILRCQDSPHPPVLWHAPGPSQSNFSENPIKKSKNEQRKQDEVPKSCTVKKKAHMTEPEIHDQCMDKTLAVGVELGMAPERHRSTDGVRENYIDNEARHGKWNDCDGSTNRKLAGKLEAELCLVEGGEKICGASQYSINVEVGENLTNTMETDLPSAKEQEIMGGDNEHSINDEPKRNNQGKCFRELDNGSETYKIGKMADEREGKENIAEACKRSINVEVTERVTDKTESDSPSTRKIEVQGRGNEFDICGERRRKQKKKRVKGDKLEAELHLAEGKNSIDVDVCEKPINRVQSDLSSAKEQEINGEELHLVEGTEKIRRMSQNVISVEVGEKLTNRIQSVLSTDNGLSEPDGKEKKKKRRVKGHNLGAELHLVGGKDKINGASENKIKVDVSENPMNKLVSYSGGEDVDVINGAPKREKRKHGKADMLGTELHLAEEKDTINGASQCLSNAEVGENPTTRLRSDLGGENEDCVSGEPKRKKHKKRKHMKEAELVGEKDEIYGASQNSNFVEVSEKPTNTLESDLPFAKEQGITGGESEGEPGRKKGRKRKLAKGDVCVANINTNTGRGTVEV